MQGLYCAAFLVSVAGHAQLYEPPARTSIGLKVGTPNCAGGSCLWFIDGSFIGCERARGSVLPGLRPKDCNATAPLIPSNDKVRGTVFTNLEDVDPDFRSIVVAFPHLDWTKYHPWRRPGTAPVEDSCGINGGWYKAGLIGTGGNASFSQSQGKRGTEMPPLLKQTTWIAGSSVEVAFGLTANHGGGYQYRLCRVRDPANIKEEATEECFQKLPLKFVGEKQWIQWGDGMDVNNRTEINATRVLDDKGTMWTRNPIPGCGDIPRMGGHNHACKKPMYDPPLPGLFGFGPGACASADPKASPCTSAEMKQRGMPFGIVDRLNVPNVPPGSYVLSWRWDCEQLPQVWFGCADVNIRAAQRSNTSPDTSVAAPPVTLDRSLRRKKVERGSAAPNPTRPFSSWHGCEICCAKTKGLCAPCKVCWLFRIKTGACARCWNASPAYTFGAFPHFHCLGHEGPGGGMNPWKMGMPFKGRGWSPGCPKCWSTPGSCRVSERERAEGIIPPGQPARATPGFAEPRQEKITNPGMIAKPPLHMLRANLHDRILVSQYLAPLYMAKYGVQLGLLGLYHSALGFVNTRTGLNSTFEYLGNTSKPVWDASRLIPKLNYTDRSMSWPQHSAGVVLTKEGLLDLEYWMVRRKIAVIDGATYNHLLNWIAEAPFDRYYFYNLRVPSEQTSEIPFHGHTCFDMQLAAIKEIHKVAGACVFNVSSPGLLRNDVDMLAEASAREISDKDAFEYYAARKLLMKRRVSMEKTIKDGIGADLGDADLTEDDSIIQHWQHPTYEMWNIADDVCRRNFTFPEAQQIIGYLARDIQLTDSEGNAVYPVGHFLRNTSYWIFKSKAPLVTFRSWCQPLPGDCKAHLENGTERSTSMYQPIGLSSDAVTLLDKGSSASSWCTASRFMWVFTSVTSVAAMCVIGTRRTTTRMTRNLVRSLE